MNYSDYLKDKFINLYYKNEKIGKTLVNSNDFNFLNKAFSEVQQPIKPHISDIEQLFGYIEDDFSNDFILKNKIGLDYLAQLKRERKASSIFLNVDSYGLLLKDGVFLENDHIPSYEALAKFFKIPVIKVKNQKIRDLNLNQNATALSIPKIMHKNNRTWGKGNIKLSKLDSYDLRIATFLDFSTLLAMKKLDVGKWETNRIDYNDLLNSFSYIYGRNAQLCLYY